MDAKLKGDRRGFMAGAGILALTPAASAQIVGEGPTDRSGHVSIRHFGAVGDGIADDTAAIQRAIAAVTGNGGIVAFPPGRYLITGTLRVHSLYPISLIGEMGGNFYDAAGAAAALLVGADMAYVIEFAAPDPHERARHGSGTVQGLAFVDPTSPDNGSPGRRRVTSALHLRDFGLGLVEGCSFHWIRGSAILTDFAVMSTIRGCRIRYCGDRAHPERSAIYLGATSRVYNTQAFLLDDIRIEVCYSDRYVRLASDALDIIVRSCMFEAATVEYPASSNTFLETSSERFVIEGCFFNRTDAVAVTLGGRGKLVGCHFINGPGSATSLVLRGDRCIISSCIFEDNRTALSIDCSGVQNIISGNTFYYSGGVRLTGRGNLFTGNQISNPRKHGPDAFLVLGNRCVADNNRFDGNGSPTDIAAITTRDGDRVTNNAIDRWGQIGIQRASAASVIADNTFTEVSRPYASTLSAKEEVDSTASLRGELRKLQDRIDALEQAAHGRGPG